MRLISAGSLVRAQSGPPNKVKVRRLKVKSERQKTRCHHNDWNAYPAKPNCLPGAAVLCVCGLSSKIENEFRLRLAGHKPGTEDNLRKESKTGL